MKWVKNEAPVRDRLSAYRILVGKTEGRKNSENLDVDRI
jgi:hypothetical protein